MPPKPRHSGLSVKREGGSRMIVRRDKLKSEIPVKRGRRYGVGSPAEAYIGGDRRRIRWPNLSKSEPEKILRSMGESSSRLRDKRLLFSIWVAPTTRSTIPVRIEAGLWQ